MVRCVQLLHLVYGLNLLVALIDNTLAYSQPFVMFCGPSQASTLLSEAIVKSLNLRSPKNLKKSCPPEFFNPSCSESVRTSKTLAFCFGSNGFHRNMWKVCSDEKFMDILELARSNGFMFAKENFGNGFQLSYLNQNNFNTFVAFRSPKHTFPTPGSKWYLDIWRSLMLTPREDLLLLPVGSDLLLLRSQAVNLIASDSSGFQRECIAHFLHYWQLIAIALNDNIPIVNIDRILLARTQVSVLKELKDAGICTMKGFEEGNCNKIARAIFEFGKNPVHMHSSHHSKNKFSTSKLFQEREEKYRKETKCDNVLKKLMMFCEMNIEGCTSVLDVYLDVE